MVLYVSYLLLPKNDARFELRFDFYVTDKNHLALANLYSSSNTTAADAHTAAAASLRAGILDLLWDSEKVCCLLFFSFKKNSI